MFGGSTYSFAVTKYFSFAFFLFIPFATQLFPLRLRHQNPQPSFATYGVPPFTVHQLLISLFSMKLHFLLSLEIDR